MKQVEQSAGTVGKRLSWCWGVMVLVLVGVQLLSSPSWGFTAAGSMLTARAYHTATLLPNGKVLVAGGIKDGSYLSSAELYNPATNSWSDAASMTSARRNHTATLLKNGMVLVAGGRDNSGYLFSAELYNPATNSWSAAARLSFPRSYSSATLLQNGQVLVSGGWNVSAPLSSAELYDPVTNSWSAAASMSTPHYSHTSTLLPNGQVFVMGGDISSSAELYNPATNSWSTAATMPAARKFSTATLLPNGQVLVVGGADNHDKISSAELYDPATNSWSDAASMTNARDSHTATLLPNGEVLVTGGWGVPRGIELSSAELYDSATNSWSEVTSMLTAHGFHTATLLPNGKVLVAGGQNDNGYLATAELYESPVYVGAPSSLSVPASDPDGSFAVSWQASATKGASYLLEEASDPSFSTALRVAYSGKSIKTTIKGKFAGNTYYYRVKAIMGDVDSAWVEAANGCGINHLVKVTAGKGGTVSPSGSVSITVGTTQIFTVVPNVGYHTTSVKVNGVERGAVTEVNAPAELMPNSKNSYTIVTKSVINSYTVTATAGTGGSIAPAVSKLVKYGQKATYTIKPASGNRVGSVLVNGVAQTGIPASGIYKLALTFTGTTTIEANFISL